MTNSKTKTDKLWDNALNLLKERLPQSSYDAWVPNLVPNGIDGDEFSVRCGQKIAIPSSNS